MVNNIDMVGCRCNRISGSDSQVCITIIFQTFNANKCAYITGRNFLHFERPSPQIDSLLMRVF